MNKQEHLWSHYLDSIKLMNECGNNCNKMGDTPLLMKALREATEACRMAKVAYQNSLTDIT